MKRKLTAILSADVAGYSRLISEDEAHTIQTLKNYRNIMSDQIQSHSGRVVDTPGDNLLAEFASAVDAVQCAVKIQRKLKQENDRFVENKRLRFRIGINIGDVAQDGDRIYGDGVNVASRIEGIADSGGICISRNTHDQVKEKLDLSYDYLGEHEVKNIKEPVRVYKVLLDSDSPKPLVKEQLELPEKPSIAVLSFDNMSGDPSQEYFSDGLTEQIINGLCKVNNLFVIARNSSFAYKGKSISIRQIAQELGVKYILEGSVQKAGERVRITAQLIDAVTDYHMWSASYDKDLSDIFALQDEITINIIWEMGMRLTTGERARLYQKDIRNIQAFDMYSRGMKHYAHSNKHDSAKARFYFEQALELEENSAAVHSLLGFLHLIDLFFNWSDSPADSFVEAEKYAQKALALNDSLDLPHELMAWIHLIKKEYNEAILESNRGVALNPNGAVALLSLGFITLHAGEPKEAVIHLERAFRLNPIPPSYYYLFLGIGYILTDQYEKGVEILNKGIRIDPESLLAYINLTVGYYELNKIDKAQSAVKKVLEIDPNFSLEYFKSQSLQKDQELNEKFFKTLRKAGLPD